MRTLGVSLSMAQRATASGARLFQVLDRAPEAVAPPGSPPLGPGSGRVEFQGVELRYPGAPRPALHDVDLVVEAGTHRGARRRHRLGQDDARPALSGLYDAHRRPRARRRRRRPRRSTRGRCAGRSPSSTTIPFLFSASVAENIAYARADASQEEIEQAARRAQAHEFISRLPDGYDTRVGERGLTLSGGQRQRLAIARAFLADPRILVLDDATSAVDASTEQAIKLALRDVMAGRTTFVIAHRLSTIALADEIVVIEDGTVAAHGSHDELLDAQRRSTARSSRRACPTRSSSRASRASRRWRGCDAPSRPRRSRRRDDLRRRLRGTSGRGRKLRGLLVLLRPVPRARDRDVRGARPRHGRVAGARAAGEARDRRRHPRRATSRR